MRKTVHHSATYQQQTDGGVEFGLAQSVTCLTETVSLVRHPASERYALIRVVVPAAAA